MRCRMKASDAGASQTVVLRSEGLVLLLCYKEKEEALGEVHH